MSFVPEFMQSYVDSARKVQENWIKSFESVTENAGKKVKLPAISEMDPEKGVDEFFDRWIKAIETQRAMTKKVVGFQVEATKSAVSKAEAVGGKGREQAAGLLAGAKGDGEGVAAKLEEQMHQVAETMNEQLRAAKEAVSELTGVGRNKGEVIAGELADDGEKAAEKAEEVAHDSAEAAENAAENSGDQHQG